MFSAWYGVSVLVVSLSLGNSAPTTPPPSITRTTQDCEATVTPLDLDNPAKMLGRWNWIGGFADNDLFVSIMKTRDSAWIDITASPEDNGTWTITEYNRINGTCIIERAQIAFNSDTITIMDIIHHTDNTDLIHIINKGSLLPTCVNCLLFNFTTSVSGVSTPIHTLHLLAREQSLQEADLRAFRQQAKCLNFSLPARFPYSTDQAREQSLQEADLRAFRQQAKCLNFSLPARFHYSLRAQEFCPEDNMTVAYTVPY